MGHWIPRVVLCGGVERYVNMKKHTKTCECEVCVKSRVEQFLERIEDRSRMVPLAGQSVPVRAHWRRHPNHLRKLPETRALLLSELRKLRKEA